MNENRLWLVLIFANTKIKEKNSNMIVKVLTVSNLCSENNIINKSKGTNFATDDKANTEGIGPGLYTWRPHIKPGKRAILINKLRTTIDLIKGVGLPSIFIKMVLNSQIKLQTV